MKGYLDPMIDIAEQLCLKWERLNPDEPIDVTADMTRLTLDTIALCGFSYRFNSFYRDTQHPFVEAMMGALHETQARQRLLPVAVKMRRGAQRQLLADSKFMDDTVAEILAERKAVRRSRAPTCWGTCWSAPTSRATRCPTTTSSPSA